ncbi:uncharacterized protein LOC120341149 [Styela clava]|uniref:uncharacterized protein LOC120341149 n=1 Tax=Styela clava TaxID=7725 RepID=UPI0019395ED1|nr:uncharacterized protein LOC120341149 [Styela clava]
MILCVSLLMMPLSFALVSTASISQRCHLPKVTNELDAEKLIGTTWYAGLQTNDIAASMISCARFNNFTSTNSSFGILLTEHGVRFVQFGVHFNNDGNGTYLLSKSDRKHNHAKHESEMNAMDRKAVLDMDNFFDNGDHVFLTDYENYFAIFICPPNGVAGKGHRLVWGCFSNPTPTLSQVAAFINVLHEVGISANFHASTCSETNWLSIEK